MDNRMLKRVMGHPEKFKRRPTPAWAKMVASEEKKNFTAWDFVIWVIMLLGAGLLLKSSSCI